MKVRFVVAGVAIFLMMLVGAGSARADITYSLTVDNCTGGCNPGIPGTSMGTVLLHEVVTGVPGDVKVTVTLVSPLEFVNTGLHETIDFNLGSIPSGVTADTFSNSNFSLLSGTAGSNHFDGFGDFQYAILLNTAQGAGGAQASPLSFDVKATGLLESSFTTNSTGWVFGVDVYNSRNGNTGPIGVGSGGTLSGGGSPVPEPASIVLLGTLLIGIAGTWRAKVKRNT